MNPVLATLPALCRGAALSAAEAERAVGSLLDGEVSEAVAAAFLTAMRVKGESADELEGAVRAVRARMVPWESPIEPARLVDTCGTGGDGAGTVNLSTAAAIVVAACGVPVVKHGNRAASGRSGSSDVLSALGVASDPGPDLLRRCLQDLNIAFLFAPRFHPGLKQVAAVRSQLPFRTVFNLIGPLCNPAGPGYQLIGTPDEARAELLADVLARLPHLQRAAVVTGLDGLDEVTLDGSTSVRVVEAGTVRRESWRPEDFGLERSHAAVLRVGSPEESAERIRRIFHDEPGPARDYVLANSAAALWVTGRFALREGVARAATAIDSGAAARLLDRWTSFRG
ncbi:MAG TPA: anthranilate phosphoribosyltransferase [Isosphaeraceae bacterium]|nr:anthranilate phosphoribosyltransferase [Isosphaeraceae bacterium]